MQTGLVTNDNLSEVLRGLSQKRKQGVLELAIGQEKWNISFLTGKIVEVSKEGENPVETLFERISASGRVTQEVSGELDSYKALLVSLNENGESGPVIDSELMKSFVKHHMLNKLYEIDLGNGAYYSFHTQMIEVDADLQPSISIGQLLLDLVGLETDSERFAGLFPEDVRVVPSGDPSQRALSDEESSLLEHSVEEPTIGELRARSLLSSYHFQEIVFGLYEAGLIEIVDDVVGTGEGSAPSGELDIQQVLSGALDRSIDDVFESEGLIGEIGILEEGPIESAVLEEEDDFDDYDDEDELESHSSLQLRLGMISMRLQSANWVPSMLAATVLITAAFAPLVLWKDFISFFGY